MLKTISRTFFSLVFPLSCEFCGKLVESRENAGVCAPCESRIRRIAPPHCPGCGRTCLSATGRCESCSDEKFHFDRAYACVAYESGIKEIVHGFKFGRKRFLAPFLTRILTGFVHENLAASAWDLVVPVPMDRKRENERGFNQSKLLSRSLAQKLELLHGNDVLGCVPSERPQAFLNRSERKANAQGRFFVKKRLEVHSRNILLVDDILTTGQTASACAQVLKEAGARSVTVLALARGL
jgi:competence protein ComFC